MDKLSRFGERAAFSMKRQRKCTSLLSRAKSRTSGIPQTCFNEEMKLQNIWTTALNVYDSLYVPTSHTVLKQGCVPFVLWCETL